MPPPPEINVASSHIRAGCVLAEVKLRGCLHLYKISCHGDNCAIMDKLYGKLQESEVQGVLL